MTTGDAKVPLTIDNVDNCICPQCPVQTTSECIKSKTINVKTAMNKIPLASEDIPGMYCSTGKASCQDIDTNQMCICEGCLLWFEYNLNDGKPKGYYCRDGVAI